MSYSPDPIQGMRTFSRDKEALKHKMKPGTIQRIIRFIRPYSSKIIVFLFLVVCEAAVGVVNPLVYRQLVNRGILLGNARLVIILSLLAVVFALVGWAFTFAQRYVAVRIGHIMLFDLRMTVFAHIQRMPLAFFTQTRTGALVSRLDNDVTGVRDAFTDTISTAVGNLLTVLLILTAMFALSWQITTVVVVLVPAFMVPVRYVSRRLRALTRENYNRAAEISDIMVERFNVAGAQASKIFARPKDEQRVFELHASRVRDIGITIATYARFYYVALGLVSSLGVAAVYGWGGVLAAHRILDVGTLIALVAYLMRLNAPLIALSNLQVSIMTTLVSFERIFEILDLQPMIVEAAHAKPIPACPVRIEFVGVGFRYPSAAEVSIASLESVAILSKNSNKDVLHDISFVVEPGQLVAIVGPSGAGKTTLSQLVTRLYDVRTGVIRINGVDLRDATFDSIRQTVGVVTQEAHLFHDTIRANLLYAKTAATETELTAALCAAQILPLVQSLPQRLDTVVGDRGYRLSGGERQRIAIARLLLKAPSVVILDEATAHLDSESENEIQRAFDVALAGRTSIVIAHRLSTIRSADLILVLDDGCIVERGRHKELLEAGKLYAQLYKTQFR
jgi:ATP-binding cassette subfamily B protein